MKKILIIMVSIALVGCNNMEGFEENVFVPVTPDDDVATFFQEYLPITYGYHFFDQDDRKDKCIVINSVADFKKRFSGSSTVLPAIDFKSHTLIIGHFETAMGGARITEQDIVAKSGKAVLNVRWGYPSGVLLTGAFTTHY